NSLIQGSKSIYKLLRMFSIMNFTMIIIPYFVIFSKFYIHLVILLITIVIFQFMGFYISEYYLHLLYFIFASFCLLFSISLVTSTFSTIFRDFHMFLNSTLRMLLYVSGVLWPFTFLEEHPLLVKVMKMNPIYYLIEGYRAAFFGTEWYFITEWQYSLFFWAVVLLLFCFGS